MSHLILFGSLEIDPLFFSVGLFIILILFVLYLLLPRGFRVYTFHAYPKRHAWSARPRRRNNMPSGAPPTAPSVSNRAGSSSNVMYGNQRPTSQALVPTPSNGSNYSNSRGQLSGNNLAEETVDFESGGKPNSAASNNDEVAISSAMEQLRDPGVLIVAHGSRGKPKTVRLQLTENAITWRTETRKKNANGQYLKEIKLGKLHSVSLTNIMYVDVGKQTTALRRVENSAVPEALCFSLLTKEGSLDLESNSPRERDALVSCFSLVLDEVHAQNWRDIYRGHSAEMASSFDEYDEAAVTSGQIP